MNSSTSFHSDAEQGEGSGSRPVTCVQSANLWDRRFLCVCARKCVCVWRIILINVHYLRNHRLRFPSVLPQRPRGRLDILAGSEVSHPWKRDPGMTPCLPAGLVTCGIKEDQCGRIKNEGWDLADHQREDRPILAFGGKRE